MGYVEDHLMPDETIIYKAKLHWAMFISPAVFTGLFLITFLILTVSDVDALCGASFWLLIGFAALINALIDYFTTEFGVTDKRVIAKTGLIRRRSLELLLTKVESVRVDQPILGRLLDYGTITVVGTGGTKEKFKNIIDPMELRGRVHTQISSAS